MDRTEPQFPTDDLRSYLDEPRAWLHMSQGLQRIALAIVGNERDAEDIVQTAWLEILKRPRRGINAGWLKKLVRLRALDALRSKRSDPLRLDTDVSSPEPSGAADMRWKLDAQREVLEAVQGLREPYLETVVLRYFEGKGPQEIARQLGVPERTVKTRLTRAHELLRERLSDSQKDPEGNWLPGMLAFSGLDGLKVSPLSMPITGLLLMKKSILIAGALAMAILLPIALHSQSQEHEALTRTDPELTTELTPEAVIEAVGVPQDSRTSVAESSTLSEPEAGAVEYAFPRKPDSEVGTLALRVRRPDGSPHGNYRIGLMPKDAEDAHLMSLTVYADEAGFVEVDQLAPGTVDVYPDGGRVQQVQILAGVRTQLELESALGLTVRGRVLSPQGTPIAGASIFQTMGPGSDAQSHPAALSDAEGRYELPNVRSHGYVSARASGYAPSFQVQTLGDVGHSLDLDLVLRAGGGSLSGVALSPSGRPVVGARVRVELRAAREQRPLMADPNVDVRAPLAFEVQTDRDGRFATDQLGAGEITVLARTQSWQPWEEQILLRAGEARELSILFEQGVTLSGTVRDADGDALPGAIVFTGKYAAFEFFRTKTDELGRFEFHGLPPGFSEFQTYKKGYIEDNSALVLRTATAAELDITLVRLPSARGVVVDQSGAPLVRWLVAVESPVGHWYTSAWTDEDGRFELLGIPAGTTDLVVCTEDFMQTASRIAYEAVLPSAQPLRLVVPDSTQPTSSVRMRLTTGGSPAPLETCIRLRSTSVFVHREVYPQSDGTLAMDKLASGRFRVEVSLTGYATLIEDFVLGAGEDLDLGTLELERGGRVEVLVKGGATEVFGRVEALDAHNRVFQTIEIEGGQGVSGPLPTGPIQLRFSSAGLATQMLEASVLDGDVTVVRFAQRPGVQRSLSFVRKNGEPMRYETHLTVTDSRDAVHYYTDDFQRLLQPDGITRLDLSGLEVGPYQIRIQDPGGQSEVFWLQVASLDQAPGEPQSFQLDW